MVIIRFQSGDDWFKPNWIFRQIIDDVDAEFPNDNELRFVLQQAVALGALFLDTMERRIAAKTLQAVKMVAEETIQGRIPGWKRTKPEDQAGQLMYLESISELLELLRKNDAHPGGDHADQKSGNQRE